jgi:CBS domain containing-hemolysin-like protein
MMAQSPVRNESSENENRAENRALPMVIAGAPEASEGWLTRVMRILFGWKAASTRADLELVLTADEPQSGFSPEEATMLKNILGLRETRIERVMVPRADIVAVQQDMSLGELVKVFEGATHSRLVVYNDTLDDPSGMVHIRDLLAFMATHATVGPATQEPASNREPAESQSEDQPVSHPEFAELNFTNIDLAMSLVAAKIIRETLYAPPSMPALDLLAKMQATRIHLALVIDEYGGTDGLVSIEDLVELIVGDIADEHDEEEGQNVIAQTDGAFIANGRASLEEVRSAIGEQFDVGEVAKEVDTIGGYLVTKAGHVPVRGELVPGPEPFETEVLDADPRRVKRVRIYLRKDRRPGAGRDATALPRAPTARPTPPRDEPNRTNPNPPRTP